MTWAVAVAEFIMAEGLLERFLWLEFPKLDVQEGGGAAVRRMGQTLVKYLQDKGVLFRKAHAAYEDVIKRKVAHWVVAGMARVGQLHRLFADSLYTAPVPTPRIPKVLRTPIQRKEFLNTFHDAFCDVLEDKAKPLEKKGMQHLAFCLQKSAELSLFNRWSSLCERELNQISLATYPRVMEIRAEPGYLALRPALSPLLTEFH
ncbi:MAG: hypothetical protein JRH20_28940 [Deltaproteobacteria bacterium]|nr:hypothetical protein [Deltaproteobacteria bacterium]